MEIEAIKNELARFNITDTAIAELANLYMGLSINGIDDKAGLDAVHKARIEIKNKRVAVTKTGKSLREEANSYLKIVLTEEKRILNLLQPIEDHLSDEEGRVTAELARIKAEADAAAAAKIQDRVNNLFKMGCTFDGVQYSYAGVPIAEHAKIKSATDEQFSTLVTELQSALDAAAAEKAAEEKRRLDEQAIILAVQQEQEAERQRLEVVAKQQRAEQERLAKEREEAEAKIREQQAEIAAAKQKLIDDEDARVKSIEAAKVLAEQEKLRAEELERARAEAAAKALKEAEDKATREKADADAKAEKARIAAERKAARQPDRVKLTVWVKSFNDTNNPCPTLTSEEGKAIFKKAFGNIENVLQVALEETEAL